MSKVARPCYVFDIDGTIANRDHRLHFVDGAKKDFESFHKASDEDTPYEHIVQLMIDLSYTSTIIIVSGRPDVYEEMTKDWLEKFDIPYDVLYMRLDGDKRPDTVVKSEMLYEMLGAGWEPIMVFDDRKRVVDMWRENGVPCAQVANGDF